ncbi:hypothetical protein Pint_17883 [Pistacia integerrima]|uniref:Uncharacterized protein n=1 Tax=Pistacia integerrima TaxID=434235 RepID=A0ACC0YXZ5_9ROSI|nr:hypothetical protein Pint_17883 [Pistacia integerrima]
MPISVGAKEREVNKRQGKPLCGYLPSAREIPPSMTVDGGRYIIHKWGMMEINDREIALDDMYSLNLSKLDEWKGIILIVASDGEDKDEDDDNDSDSDEIDDNGDDDAQVAFRIFVRKHMKIDVMRGPR